MCDVSQSIYTLNGIVDNNLIHNVMHIYNYAYYENCMHITSPNKSRSQLTNGREGFHLVSPHHSRWPCCKETWVARWNIHRIRRLIAWSLKAVKTLSEWKKMNRNTLEILGSWRLFHVFSIWNLLNSSWQLWKTPNFQVQSCPTTLQASRCCHAIAISRCNSPYFKGAIWDSMIPWRIQPFQTTSNHLNIQFQPLKTSLTNRLDQSNLLKYTGDWWLFWNQFWDTASIIPFNSIRSHLKDSICVFVPPHHSRSLWRTLSTPLFGPPRHFHITVPFKGDVGDDPSCQKGNKWGKKMICKKALWKNRKALTLVTSTFHWG